jgi:hypothetical protein
MRRGSRGNSAPGTRNAATSIPAAMIVSSQMASSANMSSIVQAGIAAVVQKDEDNESESSGGDMEGDASSGSGRGLSLFGQSGPTLSPELEARRQLLIENLIGMVWQTLINTIVRFTIVPGVPRRLGLARC